MPRCLICNSDREFHKLGQHVRTIHHMSIEDYKKQYPGAPTVSQEYSSYRSEILKLEFKDGRMDTPDRRKQVERFINKGIEYKQSVEGRKQASELQKRIWESLTPQERKNRMQVLEIGKKEWMENYPEEFLEHQSYAAYKSATCIRMTGIHIKVSNYLLSIGVDHLNEQLIKGVAVDIYIPSLDKVIECNGEFWHGNPDVISVEDMSYYQLNGYKRDLRRKKLFKDNILFLWESEINDDSYVDKLTKFLTI